VPEINSASVTKLTPEEARDQAIKQIHAGRKPLSWPRMQIMIPPTIDELITIRDAVRDAKRNLSQASSSQPAEADEEYDPFADDDD
jgi:hypothetical protein